MPRTTSLLRAAIVGAVLCLPGACGTYPGSDAPEPSASPTAYTTEGLTCDADKASPAAQTTNELVGGRAENGFRVRFSQSTEVGIVALVTGDTEKAYRLLHEEFGVAIVARVARDKDVGRIDSFAQVTQLVAAVCGPNDAGH